MEEKNLSNEEMQKEISISSEHEENFEDNFDCAKESNESIVSDTDDVSDEKEAEVVVYDDKPSSAKKKKILQVTILAVAVIAVAILGFKFKDLLNVISGQEKASDATESTSVVEENITEQLYKEPPKPHFEPNGMMENAVMALGMVLNGDYEMVKDIDIEYIGLNEQEKQAKFEEHKLKLEERTASYKEQYGEDFKLYLKLEEDKRQLSEDELTQASLSISGVAHFEEGYECTIMVDATGSTKTGRMKITTNVYKSNGKWYVQ